MEKRANAKKRLIWLLSVSLSLLLIVCGCAIYVNDCYHADQHAIEAFAADKAITQTQIGKGMIAFEPEEITVGLIFYPGGKVEYTAYVPLMQALADRGVLCVLIEMPCNLAVLDMNAADGVQARYPDVERWYIGGHSLGGSMAASYLAKHTEDFDGIVLLGAYSTADLSATSLEALSLFGSEDKVMNRGKYDKYKKNLPSVLREIEIQGGCHAYFGMYGAQDGDGIPTISAQEQIYKAADYIWDFVSKGEK